MKSTATYISSLLYLAATIGLLVNFHYCEGEIQSVRLASAEKVSCCSKMAEVSSCHREEPNGEKESNDHGCCDDEIKLYQVGADQRIVQLQNIVFYAPAALFGAGFQLSSNPSLAKPEVDVEQLTLPPPLKQPIWLVNCSLTYYG